MASIKKGKRYGRYIGEFFQKGSNISLEIAGAKETIMDTNYYLSLKKYYVIFLKYLYKL